MKDLSDLVDLQYLKKMLGYREFRSVRTWCKKNGVPLIVLGRITYTERRFIMQLINKRLGIDNSPEGPADAIRNNLSTDITKATETTGIPSKRKEKTGNKNVHSKAAVDLINALNSTK